MAALSWSAFLHRESTDALIIGSHRDSFVPGDCSVPSGSGGSSGCGVSGNYSVSGVSSILVTAVCMVSHTDVTKCRCGVNSKHE